MADELFSGSMLEEKIAAVFLLEKMDAQFGDREFQLFESWLDRISSWADHDGLVHYLIAPMVAAKPARVKDVFRWAKSREPLAPARGLRGADSGDACRRQFFPQIKKLSDLLLADQDDMVQKGLGWLLRETAKYDPKRTVPYLMKIRERAPRLGAADGVRDSWPDRQSVRRATEYCEFEHTARIRPNPSSCLQ